MIRSNVPDDGGIKPDNIGFKPDNVGFRPNSSGFKPDKFRSKNSDDGGIKQDRFRSNNADEVVIIKPRKSIVLIGMMGVGKSSIGNQLAKKLGMMFYDSDHEIEKSAGVTSAAIYELMGEPAFREVERTVIRRLLKSPPCIISTGDSTFLSDEIRAELLDKTIVVWLQADWPTIANRLKNSRIRPQLIGADQKKTLEILVTEREPIYSLAHIKVASDDQTYDRMVSRLIKAYTAYVKYKEYKLLSQEEREKLIESQDFFISEEDLVRLESNEEPFYIEDYDEFSEEKPLIVLHHLDKNEEDYRAEQSEENENLQSNEEIKVETELRPSQLKNKTSTGNRSPRHVKRRRTN